MTKSSRPADSAAVDTRLPLSLADREEARSMALIEEIPPRAWVVEEARDGGKLKTVKICSAVSG